MVLKAILVIFCIGGTALAGQLPDVGALTLHSHFDAGQGVLVQEMGSQSTDRGPVGFWQDRSGNGRHLRQIISTKKPFWLSGLINGRPAIRFYGAYGDHPRFEGREYSLWTTFSEPLQKPNTFFVVVNTRNVLNEYVFDGISSSSRQYLAVGSLARPRTWMFGSGQADFSTDVVSGEFLVHTLIFNGAQSKHYVNGVLQTVTDTGGGTLGGLRVGGRFGESHFGDMDVAEFVIYSGAADENDRTAVERHLMAKYGLAPQCGGYRTGFPVADLNRDCIIDFQDFVVLAQQWLADASSLAEKAVRYPTRSPIYTDVFWQGQNGIHTYRIPSVVTTPNGVVMAFAEARKTSSTDKSPTKLVLRRSYSGGQSWLEMQTVVDVGNNAAMDPTPVIDEQTGRVWLFYTVWPAGWDNNPVPGLVHPSCTVWLTYSDNDGASWSAPTDITASVKLPAWTGYNIGPGVGIQVKNGPHAGRLIVSASGGGNNHIIYSDNQGQTWSIAGSISTGAESQIVELSNGHLLMNIRGGRQFGRLITRSINFGMSWSPLTYDTALIEPHGIGGSACQASILRYTTANEHGRNRIVFSNPASGVARQNMTVRISYDECQTWPLSRIVWPEAAGYSCLTVLPDDTIGILFESGQTYSAETITFASFSLEWLTHDADRL